MSGRPSVGGAGAGGRPAAVVPAAAPVAHVPAAAPVVAAVARPRMVVRALPFAMYPLIQAGFFKERRALNEPMQQLCINGFSQKGDVKKLTIAGKSYVLAGGSLRACMAAALIHYHDLQTADIGDLTRQIDAMDPTLTFFQIRNEILNEGAVPADGGPAAL